MPIILINETERRKKKFKKKYRTINDNAVFYDAVFVGVKTNSR
jgi:hypothetical protein